MRRGSLGLSEEGREEVEEDSSTAVDRAGDVARSLALRTFSFLSFSPSHITL